MILLYTVVAFVPSLCCHCQLCFEVPCGPRIDLFHAAVHGLEST